MKIGITCYPTYGGSGVVATELGKELASKGHMVHFISYAMPFRLNEFSSNIYYHEVDISNYPLFQYPPYSIALASKMADVISYEKLDLLHVHYAIPHAISAFLAKEMLSDTKHPNKDFKIITTLHGTDITLIGQEPSMLEAVKLGLNRSDGITAVSEFLKDTTDENFNLSKEIEVIPNFIDTNIFYQKHCENYRQIFADQNQRVIIHISNFRAVKRVKEVVRIFHTINQATPSILLLVGDGPERSEAEHIARDLGISHKVKFLGRQEAIVELLSISDLMIMPSKTESFGLAALEALACGVPVIASKVGGLPELIEHNQNGCLHPVDNIQEMAECAITILNDSERLKQFSDSAIKRAKKYDAQEIVPLYEQYYQKILEKG
jgi:N-acetyl-alpha-D-glucosaminyl L-malate synthase BshA